MSCIIHRARGRAHGIGGAGAARTLLATAALLCALGVGSGAYAAPADETRFTGGQGDLAAEAVFRVDPGGVVTITLTNTSKSDTLVPSDLLSGIFFGVSDPTKGGTDYASLTRKDGSRVGSVMVGAGKGILNAPSLAGTKDVGGEFGFLSGLEVEDLVGASYNYGVSSSGLGEGGADGFGPGTRFNTKNLEGNDAPGGMNFGIVSEGDDATTGNMPLKKNPLISYSVVITLYDTAGAASKLQSSWFNSVRFQYGTSLSQPNFTGKRVPGEEMPVVPEPGPVATAAVFGLAVAGVLAAGRRRASMAGAG